MNTYLETYIRAQAKDITKASAFRVLGKMSHQERARTLVWAANWGYLTLLGLVIQHNKKAETSVLNWVSDEFPTRPTAFIAACTFGHPKCARLLFAAGAKPFLEDINGDHALIHATRSLLVWTLYPDDANPGGELYKTVIKQFTHLPVGPCRFIDHVAGNGLTPLMLACTYPVSASVVSFLLARKHPADTSRKEKRGRLVRASPHVANEHGKTALIVAAINGNDEVVNLLLDAGVDKNHRDMSGKTALEHVREQHHQRLPKSGMSRL